MSSSDIEIVSYRSGASGQSIAGPPPPRASGSRDQNAGMRNRDPMDGKPARRATGSSGHFDQFDVDQIDPLFGEFSYDAREPGLPREVVRVPYKVPAKVPVKAPAAKRVVEEIDSDSDMENGVKPNRKKPNWERSTAQVGKGAKKTPVKKAVPKQTEVEKAAKKDAKSAEKAQREQAKGSAAATKAAINAANNLKNDRKESIKEITLRISGLAFEDSGKGKNRESAWRSITSSLQGNLREAESNSVKSNENYQSEGAVEWTRKCDKRWIQARERFEPLPMQITVQEDSKLIFMTATELIHRVERGNLQTHLKSIRESIPTHHTLFLMLFQCDRAFSRMQEQKEEVELEIMRAQIHLKLRIIHAETEVIAVRWLFDLTGDISAKPYQKLKYLPWATTLGPYLKIEGAPNLSKTFEAMLATIKGVTGSHAKGIVSLYPTWKKLYDAYRTCGDVSSKERLLVDIIKRHKVDGGVTNTKLGPAISKRVYYVVCATDGSDLIECIN